MSISAYQIFGEACRGESKGLELYSLIAGPFERGEAIEIDFDGVCLYNTLFFNKSVARLIASAGRERYESLVSVVNLSDGGKDVYESVVDIAARAQQDREFGDAIGAFNAREAVLA